MATMFPGCGTHLISIDTVGMFVDTQYYVPGPNPSLVNTLGNVPQGPYTLDLFDIYSALLSCNTVMDD